MYPCPHRVYSKFFMSFSIYVFVKIIDFKTSNIFSSTSTHIFKILCMERKWTMVKEIAQ